MIRKPIVLIDGRQTLLPDGDSVPGVSADNFSYTDIDLGSTVTIPSGQEMLFSKSVRINGTLKLNGSIRQVNYDRDNGCAFNKIKADETLVVYPDRDLLFRKTLRVLGTLRILGRLIEV